MLDIVGLARVRAVCAELAIQLIQLSDAPTQVL